MQIFRIIFMYAFCLSLHSDVKSSSISCKIEVNIKSKFHFGVSIDVFNHFKATNNKSAIVIGVNYTTTYKLFDSCE